MATTKRRREALSVAFVRTVNEVGTYSDGNGLNLRVEKTGTKRWIQRVTRCPMEQHPHHLRVPENWVQAGHRHHHRGYFGGPVADLDGEAGDGEPGEATHGDGAGLGGCPRLPY